MAEPGQGLNVSFSALPRPPDGADFRVHSGGARGNPIIVAGRWRRLLVPIQKG